MIFLRSTCVLFLLLLKGDRSASLDSVALQNSTGQETPEASLHSELKKDRGNVGSADGIEQNTLTESVPLVEGCRTIRNKNNCNADQACTWIDNNCVDYPPSCDAFLRRKSCNQFLGNCMWEDGKCISGISYTVFPTESPIIYPETSAPVISSPTSLDERPICDTIGSRMKPSPKPFTSPRNNPIPTPTVIVVDTQDPTGSPTKSPTISPTKSPTPQPTQKPVDASTQKKNDVTFRRGDLKKDIKRFGFKVCTGMSVRMVAKADVRVNFANGKKSKIDFHSSPDGATIFPLENGYVYVSNSEVTDNKGGVFGLYFDNESNVIDYKALLTKTTRNCSGGKTPWNTFVSCEEYANGQCWQVDPLGERSPELTKLGGNGGNYESVACDNRNLALPIFFVSEDHEFGKLLKYTPPLVEDGDGFSAGWDSLHKDGGMFEYLVFLDDSTFAWTTNIEAGRNSQSAFFPNVEGIDYRDGMLYFVSKKTYKLYVLDLDNGTYTTSKTNGGLMGAGEFKHSPDQLIRNDGQRNFLYFTEDGGKTAGVYAVDQNGKRFAIFEAYDPMYFNDETTGLAFSPDGNKMYACFQDCGCDVPGKKDCGCLMEFRRDDGLSFDGLTLSLKFHSSK